MIKKTSESLLQKFPDIAAEWDYKRNGELTPSSISYGSNKTVFWECPKCGYSYSSRIANRTAPSRRHTNGNHCPICLGREIIPGYNSLQDKYPKIALDWDSIKNNITPDQIAPHSNKKYWWICKEGHSYMASPNNRTNNVGNCPYCSHQKLYLPTSLQIKNPSLAQEWDYEANSPRTPSDVFANSNEYAYWICSKCGHKWKAKITNRSHGRGCPMCSKGQHTSFPEQVIFYYVKLLFPNAINGYKIKGQEIDVYIPSLMTGIEYDGEFYHKKQNRVQNDLKKNRILKNCGIHLIRIRESRCPEINDGDCIIYKYDYSADYHTLEPIITLLLNELCSKAGLRNTLAVHISDIRNQIISDIYKVRYEDSFEAFIKAKQNAVPIAIWDTKRNAPLSPDMVMPFSEKKVYWICPQNSNHKWRNTVKSVSLGYGCSRCSKKHHYSTEEWIDEARKTHGDKYDYSKVVYINAKEPVTIICPIHGDFSQSPSEHLSGKGCKYCARQAFHPLDSLAFKYPEIAAEWDYERNAECGYTPNTIGINTSKKFWWHCTNGHSHSFQATIAKRVSGLKCAVCHGKQHSIDTSIAVLFPEICKEWSEINDSSPFEYSKGSEKKVWWTCPNSEHPDYLASIYNRVHLKSGCPICGREKSVNNRKKKGAQ